jgi:hypothetical protein
LLFFLRERRNQNTLFNSPEQDALRPFEHEESTKSLRR